MGLAILAFVVGFLLLSSLGALLFYRQAALRRLTQAVSRQTDAGLLPSIKSARHSKIDNLTKPFQKIVPRTEDDTSTVQKRLIRAGYRPAAYVNIFYSSKVLVP